MMDKTMKAFFINNPMNSEVRNTKIPEPREDEILLKVMAAGVCGTDVHIFKGEYYGGYPRIPGHEFSGIVEAVGKKVLKFRAGQHVSADPNIFCEDCDACKENRQNFCQDMHAVGVTRHGAFAQYLTVPERCVFDISGISFTAGALIEPLACVVYGQEKIRIPLGASVLIFGAGPIGLMHTQLSRMNGAANVTVVDLFEDKLVLAKKLGADHVFTAKEFDEHGGSNAYEVVIDCTGVPKVVENAVKYIKDAGTMLIFGVCPNNSVIKINPYEIFKRELTIVSTFALKKTFGKALALAKSRKIELESLVDNKLLLDDAPAFFEKITLGNTGLKTVFYFR
jgi:2-desacetyl-2-hydroxyethyl bacteriochlorophyllide A dehydrogenase